MDIGLLVAPAPGASPLLHQAREAEQAGFTSVWVGDRASPAPDPVVTLGALARVTARARIGALALAAPLRPPAVLAKSLATIDRLSTGRLVVALGAGGDRATFAAAGVPFQPAATRLAHLGEAAAVVAGVLATGAEPFSYDGRHCRVDGARCLPAPAQDPRPPVWVAGRSSPALEAAASVDGWVSGWCWRPDDYRRAAAALAAACERRGRDPAEVTRAVALDALVGDDAADLERRWRLSPIGGAGASLERWRHGRLVGTVGEVAEQVANWSRASVATMVLRALAAGRADVLPLAAACTLGRS